MEGAPPADKNGAFEVLDRQDEAGCFTNMRLQLSAASRGLPIQLGKF